MFIFWVLFFYLQKENPVTFDMKIWTSSAESGRVNAACVLFSLGY